MNEQRELDEVQQELENKYGQNRVVREPALGEGLSLRPDILVFEDEDHTSPFLIVEYSSLGTPHRRNEDIEQVRRFVEATGTRFGALVSEEIRYIFRIDQHDELVEVPISGYPDIANKSTEGSRTIGSYQMFDFLVDRVRDRHRTIHHRPTPGEFPQQLYRKYESDRQNISIQIGEDLTDDKFAATFEDNGIDESIKQRHEAYDPEAVRTSSLLLKSIFQVFSGYDLAATPLDIRRHMVEDTFTSDLFDKESAQFSTPPEVADVLVEIADISDNETVLDPASGWGYILRAANERTDDVVGVEIQNGVNNAAMFFNDLLKKTGEYITGDFLEMAVNQEPQPNLNTPASQDLLLPDSVEHVILDPPIGGSLPQEIAEEINGNKSTKTHEAFVSLALDRLAEGGRLTAIIPTSVLTASRSAWLREKIVMGHTVQGIIEINDSSLFPYVSADLAIIVVDKIREGVTAEFPSVVYDDSSDSPVDLEQAAEQLESPDVELLYVDDPSESMLPSELLGMQRAEYELSERFSELAPLGEVASDIVGGVHRPEEEREGKTPYLKLGADLDGPNTFVDSETPVADDSDLLVALKASPGKIHHPERTVVPSSNWAIARFPSEDAAIVYGALLSSDVGRRQIESMARGATIQYLPLRRLRDIIVPTYSDTELAEKADEIRRIRDENHVSPGEFNDDIDYGGIF